MVGFIFNACFYIVKDTYELSYTLDFVLGNSLSLTILLLVISYTFGYCNWYRTIVITNFINISIAYIDACYSIPVKDMIMILLYLLVTSIGVIIAVYSHVRKTKNNKRVVTRVSRQD